MIEVETFFAANGWRVRTASCFRVKVIIGMLYKTRIALLFLSFFLSMADVEVYI